MKSLKNMLPYLICNIAVFYLLPLLTKGTGSGMVILMFGMPMICFAISFVYGKKHAFHWLYTILLIWLFLPKMFSYYWEYGGMYIPIYVIILMAGNFLGDSFGKKKT